MDTTIEIKKRQTIMAELRKQLGPPTLRELKENRVQSVYASLAIEYPNITESEVRKVLDNIQ